MQRAAAIILSAVLVLVSVVTLAWLSSPWWISWVVASRLAPFGFDQVAMDMNRPGFDRLHVSRLSITHSVAGTTLTLEDSVISYRWRDLVRGRLRSMDTASARLLLPGASGRAGDRRALALPAVLPELRWGEWLPMVPTQGVTVRSAVVESTDGPMLPALALRLTGNTGNALLVARPLEPAARDRLLELVVDGSGNMNGAITYREATRRPALEFGVSMMHGEQPQWILQLAANIGELDQWLDPFQQVDWPISRCSVVGHLKLTGNPLDALALEARLSDCASPEASIEAADLSGRFMRTARGMASIGPLRLSLGAWRLAPFAGERVVLESGIDIDFEQARLTLPSGATGAFTDVSSDDVRIAAGTFTLERPLEIGGAQLPVALLTMPGMTVERQRDRATLSGIRVEWPFDATSAHPAGARVAEVELASAGYLASVTDAAIDWTLVDGRVEGSASGLLAAVIPVGAMFSVSGGTGEGSLRLEAESVVLGEDIGSASALLRNGWPAGIELVSGKLGFVVDSRWDGESLSSVAQITLDGVGGVVDGVYFSAASTALELVLHPELATRQPAPLSVAVVDYGISLKDVAAEVEIQGFRDGAPYIIASGIAARVFDGSLGIPRLTNAREDRIELILDDLDLAALVSRDRFPGLRMEGRVSGRIPVEIGLQGLYIHSGSVENLGGGIIQYDAGATDRGQADILFRALKDFEFTVLRVQPVYRPDGLLILKVHMQGTSEEFGRNRPVHFNINVEQNLLSLLESIRLVDGLNDRIDRDVNRFYEQHQAR